MQSPKLETMLTIREAADVLRCSARTLKRCAEMGEVPAMRIGNRWLFLPSALDSWRRKSVLSNVRKKTGLLR